MTNKTRHRQLCAGLTAVILLLIGAAGCGDDEGSPMEPPGEVGRTPEFVLGWGESGSGDGQFFNPTSLAVSDGHVYIVSDIRVQKFTTDGDFVRSWGGFGVGNGQFQSAHGVAVDDSGYVYVADRVRNVIQKFDGDGAFVLRWGGPGVLDSQFDRAFHIAVDDSGFVYVTDEKNFRIQKFTSQGSFVTKWGEQGPYPGTFHDPKGIVIAPGGNVYTSDYYPPDSLHAHRMQRFTRGGEYLSDWGRFGHDIGEFDRPTGLAVDSRGYVYVADGMNNRVQIFDADGNFAYAFGDTGSVDVRMNFPFDVELDEEGNIYVLNVDSRRVLKFTPWVPGD